MATRGYAQCRKCGLCFMPEMDAAAAPAAEAEMAEAEESDSWEDPVAAGDDAMEVSFDLEDGVHPEDSLFDGIHLTLFGAGSDAGSDVGSDSGVIT